jgi:transposase
VAQARLPVRKIREVLRLKYELGLSDRKIAATVGSARSTVQECLQRCRQAGIGWPLPAELDEVQLHERLYQREVPLSRVPQADFAALHVELSRPGVTRMLLWQEYKAAHRDGWQYSAFCDQYRRWLRTQELVLRQNHTPGEKLFVDYAGHTVSVTDRHSGEVRQAQIFVAVLGASNYTYAEASWTQSLPDWLGAHVRALEFIGGLPRAIVPDNLKSAVNKAHRYEPELNPAYQDFAEHYELAILPARARRPRDKAKVEVGVQVVERWILARLRNRTFFSLSELNSAIGQLLNELNNRPFKRRAGSRASVFAELERPVLRALPLQRYEFATWKKAKVHLDYHVEVERAYYSVPYHLIGKTVEVRLSAHALEIYHRQKLVAAHLRTSNKGTFTTLDAHRPARHSAVVDLTHERLMQRALAIGPATAELLSQQLHRRQHPEQALRVCLGILRLAKDFSAAALEQAAQRALALKAYSYRALRTLISTPAPKQPDPPAPVIEHDNVRGSQYFQ